MNDLPSRKCAACKNLYHPSGTSQRYCVRPFCIKERGGDVDLYNVNLQLKSPRQPGRKVGRPKLTRQDLTDRLLAAQADLARLRARKAPYAITRRAYKIADRYRYRLDHYKD